MLARLETVNKRMKQNLQETRVFSSKRAATHTCGNDLGRCTVIDIYLDRDTEITLKQYIGQLKQNK